MNRPFQLVVGMAIQIRTLSPAGGCVVNAAIRQIPGLFGSTVADSMVVFGKVTEARLSQVHIGFALAIKGFGGGWAGPPRPVALPPPAGAACGPPPRPPRCPWP